MTDAGAPVSTRFCFPASREGIGEETNEMKLLSLGFSFGLTYTGSDKSSIRTFFAVLSFSHEAANGGRFGRDGVRMDFSSFFLLDASFLFFMSSTRCSSSCVFTCSVSSCELGVFPATLFTGVSIDAGGGWVTGGLACEGVGSVAGGEDSFCGVRRAEGSGVWRLERGG